MKKILCVICLLLLCSPAFAVDPIVQGNAYFRHSPEIDDLINPNTGTVDDPDYKYHSVTDPTPTFGNLEQIFPSRLAGMAFTIPCGSTGKTAIYPGILTLQFSRSEITAFSNGSKIMDEIRETQDPIEVLFEYFDPVFVLYGTSGEKVSINIKNFPFNFTFNTGDLNAMYLSFPVILADGYPEVFCIEQIGSYMAVYDAMVSETNTNVIGDGEIEFAFALVPNEKATDVTHQKYPVLEVNGNKGYVIFDDPSEYLNIPEMSGVVSADISSGNTVFADIENGFSFEAEFIGPVKKNATLVSAAVYSEREGSLSVNGYPIETDEILLPDGTRYLTAEFVLVNSSFVTDTFVSNGTVFVFDGQTDGVLSASVEMVEGAAPDEEMQETLFYHDRGSFRAMHLEGLKNQAKSISGSFSPATLPLLNGMSSQVSSVEFTGNVSVGDSVYGIYEFYFLGSDVNIDAYLIQEDINDIFEYIRPVLCIGDVCFDLYDYLQTNGKTGLLSVFGSTQAGFFVRIPVVLSDKAPFGISPDQDYLHISDGNEDGILSFGSYIGIIERPDIPEEPIGEYPVLSSPGISLKLADITVPFLYGIEEAEADFEYMGLTDWPGKDGVLNAVSVGSFEGTYGDPFGKYVPLKMEVSVTSRDLDRLSKDRHGKIISAWSEDKSVFLDYFHVYKQTGDLVYDLVMMGGKNAFVVTGDPTTKVTASFNAVLIDDVGNISYDEDANCFVIYDGEKDGKLIDPLFVGTPEVVPTDDGEEPEEPEEPEIKHILPEGPSTGHSDLDKWIKIFSLF